MGLKVLPARAAISQMACLKFRYHRAKCLKRGFLSDSDPYSER
ncbi:MAG: hypothetical protein NVSMB53_17980 [Gemmatimonadaceae bacterium]